MKNLRRWQLDAAQPYTLQLAADARLGRTDYTDDQVWELQIGSGESPALALQTHYGGRAGLASLVPMWEHDGRTIYQHQVYHTPPVITQFAPGYIEAEGSITAGLALRACYWAMESHAAGGLFIVQNTGKQVETLRLDLFGHVGMGGREQKLGIATLSGGGHALYMGEIGNLQPVVLVEGGNAYLRDGRAASPRVGVHLKIKPGAQVALRWVHAGLHTVRDSLELAQNWLEQDWEPYLQRIVQAALAIPIVQTGSSDWDLVIACAYNTLVQSLLKPTSALPYGSFVGSRGSGRGFSARGDGTDYDRLWAGQDPETAYLVVPALASVAPQAAAGILRNYLALQRSDGFIDRKPGLGGQRQELLATPLLARLAWKVYEQTEDKDFISELFPGLLKFFERWFAPDHDHDSDGLPEWQHERQRGYAAFPMFAPARSWSQGADIRLVETPDLAAYLIAEAQSLHAMAGLLANKTALKQIEKRLSSLQETLESLWNGQFYTPRDRDTHLVTGWTAVVENGRGDETHLPAVEFDRPQRLVMRISGGVSHTPRITAHIEGLDSSDKTIHETMSSEDFLWQNRQGVCTSRHTFTRVDRVYVEGLSRVYQIYLHTMDITRLDISALLPLWSGGISAERAAALAGLAADKKHFWQPGGITMVPASDPAYDPSSAEGGGGVWPCWLALVGEGLLQAGQGNRAAELLKNLLKNQTEALRQDKSFSEFYHAEQPQGLGESQHLGGITPLALLMQVAGVRIVSAGKVWTGGPLHWGRSISVQQHGVRVRRGRSGTVVDFPSGHRVQLGPDAPWQAVVDPRPVQPPELTPLAEPASPGKRGAKTARKVIIAVEYGDKPKATDSD